MMNDGKELVLYTTSGCHLCEEARVIIRDVLSHGEVGDWSLSLCDVAENPRLMEQYGIRIPVVRRVDSGEELGWPFAHAELSALLLADADPRGGTGS